MVNAELLQSMDEVELNKMKVAELKTVCEACGLSKAGKKADLIARILELQKATLAPEFPPPRSERAAAPSERAAAPSEAGSSQFSTADDELEFQMSAMEATNSQKFPMYSKYRRALTLRMCVRRGLNFRSRRRCTAWRTPPLRACLTPAEGCSRVPSCRSS
jgi:hypothetical protein